MTFSKCFFSNLDALCPRNHFVIQWQKTCYRNWTLNLLFKTWGTKRHDCQLLRPAWTSWNYQTSRTNRPSGPNYSTPLSRMLVSSSVEFFMPLLLHYWWKYVSDLLSSDKVFTFWFLILSYEEIQYFYHNMANVCTYWLITDSQATYNWRKYRNLKLIVCAHGISFWLIYCFEFSRRFVSAIYLKQLIHSCADERQPICCCQLDNTTQFPSVVRSVRLKTKIQFWFQCSAKMINYLKSIPTHMVRYP